MAEMKVAGLVWLKKYVKQNSSELMEKFLSSLTAEEKKIFETALATTWEPIELCVGIFRKAGAVYFPDHEHPQLPLARLQAHDDMRGVYKVFMRILSVEYVVGQAASMWKMHHKEGTASVEAADKNNKNKLTFILKNYTNYYPPHAYLHSGYMIGVLEVAGAKTINVTEDISDPDELKWHVEWN